MLGMYLKEKRWESMWDRNGVNVFERERLGVFEIEVLGMYLEYMLVILKYK